MRVIGAAVRTVGDLQEALSGCDQNTPIRWTYSGSDDYGDPTELSVNNAVVDATAYSVDIQVSER